MGSTRLPGKILKKVLGISLLECQIERLSHTQLVDEIVIATTLKEEDKSIVDLCNCLSIPYYQGPEEDVLKRYYETAKLFKANTIIRLTSDCPIIDPSIVDNVINYYLNNNYDYVSNTLKRTYPRGMDTEVFSFDALKKAYIDSKEIHFREHVTPFIYQNPSIFKLGSVESPINNSKYRLTVDTKEDLELITKIIESLYPNNNLFLLNEVIELLQTKSDWVKLNSHIEQKKLIT
ncbi:glycosyltransferase family protein [Fictibacillus sp. 7GRE50]|nr:glycosyltransferase family protein [Fictibacillus sp. 7GRE50]